MEEHFEPEVRLTHGERSQLAAISTMPGYRLIHRLARSEVQKFIVNLINASEAEALEKHRLAKAAAQFYQGLANVLTEEIMQYTAAPRATDKPTDLTEGVLDIGEIADQLDGVPNLLSEEADDLYE